MKDKKFFINVLMFVTFMLATSMAADAGDLQVRSVEYAASSNRLVATIYNQAPAAVQGPILVYFYGNGQKIGEVSYSEDVPRYSIVSVYINYPLAEGNHDFGAVVDPLNTVQETIESNNGKNVNVIFAPNSSAVAIAPSRKAAGEPAAEEKNPGSMGVYVGSAILIAAIIAMLLLKANGRSRGPKREREVKTANDRHAAKKDSPEKDDGVMKIRDVIGLPKGTKVRFRAQISYHDAIGKEHAYFLKDETDEIVGFSAQKTDRKEGTVSGTTGSFLGENTCVQIEKVV